MKQRPLLRAALITFIILLNLGMVAVFILDRQTLAEFWSVVSIAALLAQTVVLVVLFIRYRQKVYEILYLRKQLSTLQVDEQLPAELAESKPNVVSSALVLLLLTVLKVLRVNAQNYGAVDKGYPIFLQNNKKELLLFHLNEIQWIRAEGNLQEVKTNDGKFLVKHTMKEIDELLSSKSDDFLKVHRSWIINLSKVRAVASNWEHVRIQDRLISVGKMFKHDLSSRLFWT
ncbi:MAG: LytTR family DNA-binding domain-containing protein [Bacteroidota bacterium]